jgi:tetratricopeptide (TPR) repeat protein
MNDRVDPVRLLDGGLVDGDAPSAEMLELLGTLRGATRVPSEEARARAAAGGSWGRWLVVLGVMLAVTGVGQMEGRPRSVARASVPSVVEVIVRVEERAPIDEVAPIPVVEEIAPAALVPAPAHARRHARRRDPQPAAPPIGEETDRTEREVQLASLVMVTVPLPVEVTADAPQSEAYASALSSYARGDCESALPRLQEVIEGTTGDGPNLARRAELVLGTCLARLGWDHAAVVVLDGIAQQGAAHPYFGEALAQLARIAPRLPDPSVLVTSFAQDDEARLADEDVPSAADAAAYLQGRARYDDGDRETAARLFARVSPASPFHRAARFYEGLSEVRLHHAQRAVDAFRAVIDASADGDRYRDLATLALARLYYAIANDRHAAGDEARANELLAQAIEAWRRVPLSSEHFLDAFFEESWAIYLAGEDERALGHVFGLLSPFFEDHEHPEALVVRGTIHFEHCLFDETETDVNDFHARYDAALAALTRLEGLDDESALALYESRAASLDPVSRRLVADSILDRDSERRAAHARGVEAELTRLGTASFRATSLADRLEVELSLAHAFARNRMAEGVRSRLAAARESLVERANEIDTIALELATARRDLITRGATLSEGTTRERQIIAEQGFEIWPFDGEYWEDEVTSYREVLRDRCDR